MRNWIGVTVLVAIVAVVSACRDEGSSRTNKSGSGSGVIPMINVIVPDDYPTITEALRVAPTLSKQPGDVSVQVRTGIYNVASGEVFPLEVTKNLTVQALGDAVVIEYESQRAISAMMHVHDGTTVSGFTFTSTAFGTGAAAWGIQGFGVRNIVVSGNTFFVRNGVNCSGGGGFHIQSNVFAAPNRSPLWRSGGDIAIEVPSSEYLVVRDNTIIGMSWGVIVANATQFDMSQNIIVFASAAAVKIDNATLSLGTDRIYRNDLWMNNDDVFNSDTQTSVLLASSSYGANISADPIFVDREDDFRIHAASRAAAVTIPQPKPVGVPDTTRIGARRDVLYRTAVSLDLVSLPPTGPMSRNTSAEMLRFSVTAAPTADVELRQGHVLLFEMTSPNIVQPARSFASLRVVEAGTTNVIASFHGSLMFANGLKMYVTVSTPITIAAGKTKEFSVEIDSTQFQPGDMMQFILTRFDWSDGVLPRINDGRTQRIGGYTLTF